MEIKYYTCTLCEATCGLKVRVENNQVVKISPDKLDPFSKGYMCPKGVSLKELLNDPDRIRHPLKKTEDGWVKISWQEALDETAEQIKSIQKKYGKDAFGIYFGNPGAHSTEMVLISDFFHDIMKTKNRYSASSLDQWPHMFASYYMFGHQLMFTVADIDRTDCFVILGANPLVSNGSIMTAPNMRKRLKSLKERSGKLIVIDPRKTETAQMADNYISIRPGRDVWLLLSLVQVLFQNNMIDVRHVENYLEGLDLLKSATEDFSPESTAKITGVSANEVKYIAKCLFESKSSALYTRVGGSMQKFGGLVHWLTHAINIITGKIDKAGGMMFTRPAFDIVALTRLMRKSGSHKSFYSRVSKKPEFANELPVSVLTEEIETSGEGQIKSMMFVAGNPVLSSPSGQKLAKALEQLEFMVAVDIYLNETTSHADIILPSLVPLERDHIDIVFPSVSVKNNIKFSKRVVTAEGEALSDAQIMIGILSRYLSWGKKNRLMQFFIHSILSFLLPNVVLRLVIRFSSRGKKFRLFSRKSLTLAKIKKHPHGLLLGDLESALPKRLGKNKINLAPKVFLDDLVRVNNYKPEGGLLLIGRRQLHGNNSWMHNLESLGRNKNNCIAFINPHDVEKYKLKNASHVKISTNVASIVTEFVASEEIMTGVISLPHGFGHDADTSKLSYAKKYPGVSFNDLLDIKETDELVGTSVLSGISVQIEPFQ